MKSFPVGLVQSAGRPASCTIINRNGNGATWTPASTAPSCTPTLPAGGAQQHLPDLLHIVVLVDAKLLHRRLLMRPEVEAGGEDPGWIYKHRAIQAAAHEIRVFGGTIVTRGGDKETHTGNEETYIFDIKRLVWRRSEFG